MLFFLALDDLIYVIDVYYKTESQNGIHQENNQIMQPYLVHLIFIGISHSVQAIFKCVLHPWLLQTHPQKIQQ